MAVPRVGAVGPPLVASPAQPRHLVLQEAGGDQQPQLDGQCLQRVLHQGEQLVPAQGQLDLTAGFGPSGPTIGLLPLVGVPPVRIRSIQGGSSPS